MVKFITMESKHEINVTLINEMLQSFPSEKGKPVRPFNPTILQCDEHISNYKGIEAVFGKAFLRKEQQVVNITLIKV